MPRSNEDGIYPDTPYADRQVMSWAETATRDGDLEAFLSEHDEHRHEVFSSALSERERAEDMSELEAAFGEDELEPYAEESELEWEEYKTSVGAGDELETAFTPDGAPISSEEIGALLATELDIPMSEELYEIFPESAGEAFVEEFESPPASDDPMPIPTSNPVDFAPPTGQFWPVESTDPNGRRVSYRTTNGQVRGSDSRSFMYSRKSSTGRQRYHVGIDLYANYGDKVIACEDGRIVNFYHFLGDTNALIVEHAGIVINYGEIASDSLKRAGLAVGSTVKAGQVIGFIGRLPKGSSMLHFETYRKGTTQNRPWFVDAQRPAEILNPTKYLLALSGSAAPPATTGGGSAPGPGIVGVLLGLSGQAVEAIRTDARKAIAIMYAEGRKDENSLTDAIFGVRHPELGGRKLTKADKALVAEWLTIRDTLVRPELVRLKNMTSTPTQTPAGSSNPASSLTGFGISEERALRITSKFETGREIGFDGLSGNFDGMGVSFGLLQWNFGSGSLQPLLKDLINEAPGSFDTAFGSDAALMRSLVLTKGKQEQLRFAIDTMNAGGKRVVDPWKGYFQALGRDPAFQAIQLRYVRKRMNNALFYAKLYALQSERGLALLFDVVTQQGLCWSSVKNRAALVQKQLDDIRSGGSTPTELQTMTVIANVVAKTVLPRWSNDVLARKMTIVTGSGKVHGETFDLAARYGLTDQPATLGADATPRNPGCAATKGLG